MATGDIKNNLKKLQSGLKTVKYEKDLDIEGISKGIPSAYLPIYHYLFVDYSRHLSEKISQANIVLQGKNDMRFIESVYKILRELFSYKPPITKDQFFSKSFGERKIIMLTEIASMVLKINKSLAPKPRVKVNVSLNSGASASARLPAKPSAASGRPASADQRLKLNNKDKASGKSNSTTFLPEVVNETFERSTDDALSAQANQLQHSTLAGETSRSGVEIVSLPSDDEAVECVSMAHHNVRPIDIVKTPGRPLVESHRNNNNSILQKSPGTAQTSTQNVIPELAQILEKMTLLNDKVSGIEGRMTVLEELLSVTRNDKDTWKDIGPQHVENLAARITLLESKLKLVENKLSYRSGAANQSTYDPSTYQSDVIVYEPEDRTTRPRISSSGTTAHYTSHNQITEQHTNGEGEKRTVEKSFSLGLVSPIRPSVNGDIQQTATGSPDLLAVVTPSVSQQCSTPTEIQSNCEVKSAQAERIQNMMKETESLLKIGGASPELSAQAI